MNRFMGFVFMVTVYSYLNDDFFFLYIEYVSEVFYVQKRKYCSPVIVRRPKK